MAKRLILISLLIFNLVILGSCPSDSSDIKSQITQTDDPNNKKSSVAWALEPVTKSQVTRDEVLAVAQAYLEHTWTPTDKNVLHGKDKSGRRVDTPDAGYSRGWFQPDELSQGIPYKWGGFSSLAEFDAGIEAGKYAGDVEFKATSSYAVGVDCSGYVSRCWKLSRKRSTRDLANVCDLLPDTKQLQKGDILNKHNSHVVLFEEFVDDDKTIISLYEASGSAGKVRKSQRPLKYFLDSGYQPYRYKNIIDGDNVDKQE